jgi:hypothetical protein
LQFWPNLYFSHISLFKLTLLNNFISFKTFQCNMLSNLNYKFGYMSFINKIYIIFFIYNEYICNFFNCMHASKLNVFIEHLNYKINHLYWIFMCNMSFISNHYSCKIMYLLTWLNFIFSKFSTKCYKVWALPKIGLQCIIF